MRRWVYRGVLRCRPEVKQDSCHCLAAGQEIIFLYVISSDYVFPFPGMPKKNMASMGIAIPWF
jgi:hypothetical protein